ncbi:unnamed protein product [Notodromas monacha]|uniref:SET and MYND domain-containing protein 4 n=1 Tax=Notodromas monacha TaxID=399045 RepID=A0A7R9BUV7_9CRUS|nr:unnamed protein product [Notodromas monacha]CAG0920567.1 unnamed protein product [Notodromas monacha]
MSGKQVEKEKMGVTSDPTMDLNEKGFFRPYVMKLTSQHLNQRVLDTFQKLNSDLDRITFLHQMPFVHTLQLDKYSRGKSLKEAQEAKVRGNTHFGKGKFFEAAMEYTRGILAAPWPASYHQPGSSSSSSSASCPSISTQDAISVLPVSLGNRSACLLHLGLHQECLEDIDEAICQGYPQKLLHKLHERAGDCHSHLINLGEAKRAYESALEALGASSGLDQKKQDTWATAILEKLKDLEAKGQQVAVNHQQQSSPSGPASGQDCLFEDDEERPELTKGCNPKFPSFAKSMVIKYTSDNGRYTVAGGPIHPGETLAIEDPIVTCIMAEKRGIYCSYCLKSEVAFCSRQCRSAACQSYHKYECGIQKLLDASGMSITCWIALRIVSQSSLQHLYKLEEVMRAKGKTLVHDRANESERTEDGGMSNDGQYLSSNYETIYNMEDHYKQRRPADFIHKGLMSIFLLKCLQLSGYFGQENIKSPDELVPGDKWKPLTKEEAFIGALILRNLQIVQFNVHEISDFRMKTPTTFKGANSVSIGAGIYPTVCLMNHSCGPGIVRYFLGSKMVVKCLNRLKTGDLVSENYGPVFTRMPVSERRATLRARYWFDCACEACEGAWPTYAEMCANAHDLRLVCSARDCHSVIGSATEEEPVFVTCKVCGTKTNVFKVLKKLQATEASFQSAMGLIEAGHVKDAMKAFFELLDELDTMLAPPYKDLHLCQEFIRRCMLTMGSHWYPGKLRFSTFSSSLPPSVKEIMSPNNC